MAKEDEEKTTFITSQGELCCSKMPFGLKNAGATYQHLVDKAFQKQIGRNLEVYVDDLVIKSRTEHEIIRDMEETFKTLREINMKLNLKKCTFEIEEGTLLRYKVNTEGIMLIAELPTLTAPMVREELIVYLAATREAVSAVLMTKREVKQIPVYFVSCALQGLEINYTLMEKLVLALVHASKQLKRYFQAHTIIVITDQPIKQILSRPEVVGRLQKWSIKLSEYDIQYRPRTSVKGKILADFIVERPKDDPLDMPMEVEEELSGPWTLFTDGSSCVDGSGAGLILTNPEGAEFTYDLRFRFDTTNNEAEYEALIAGLRIAKQMGVKNLQANVDSCLVANQVNGSYIANDPGMIQYLEKVKTLFSHFKKFSIKQVPRSENKKADALSKIASTSFAHLTKQVLVEELKEKSINEAEHACRNKICDSKGHTDMILLANNACRCKEIDKGMSRLPDWIEELPHVLWEHRTMIKSSNGDTLFSLTYETEAVIPVEIGMPTMRTTEVDMVQNDEALEINLDLLEERIDQAVIREAKSKAKMEKYYNSKVRNTSFKPGDLVYRSNEASQAKESGKLSPKWEGPYEVTEALGNGAYKLRHRNGKLLPQTWNIRNLKKCYVHEMYAPFLRKFYSGRGSV
ncbi:reverse transcriptase domain-containing protein [Tanacetum coccineum]